MMYREKKNLALACVSCSLRKGARRWVLDPANGAQAELFNPRLHSWSDHFQVQNFQVNGKSPTGRASVAALKLNRPIAVSIRMEETARNRFPKSI